MTALIFIGAAAIFCWVTFAAANRARSQPVAQPANTDSVPGSPPGSGARPDQTKLPESGGIGGSSIGLGAEGEQ